MKLAIMQPYLFPYIGYFQLINLVDKFVIYDDVNFIKQGWIHKNQILVQNQALSFAVPLVKQSSFLKINDIQVNFKIYANWRNKFLKTLELAYKKAPYFESIYDIVQDVLNIEEGTDISFLARKSIMAVVDYLNINTILLPTSRFYQNQHLSGKERVLDICKIENAKEYINPIGGQKLYDKQEFNKNGICLNFIQANLNAYPQFKKEFISGLSIIDVMMFNSKDNISLALKDYTLK